MNTAVLLMESAERLRTSSVRSVCDDAKDLLTGAIAAEAVAHVADAHPEELSGLFDGLILRGLADPDLMGQHAEILEALAASAPQRVCPTTFTYGDIIWKCKTCQVGDDTCVVCQSCFQDADHRGHDVSFYISRQPEGGCCDCGDESAWAPSGFCSRHGRLSSTSELLASIPAPLVRPATDIFTTVFAFLARTVLAANVSSGAIPSLGLASEPVLRTAELRRLTVAIEWVTRTCVSFDGMCCVAAEQLCSPLREAATATESGTFDTLRALGVSEETLLGLETAAAPDEPTESMDTAGSDSATAFAARHIDEAIAFLENFPARHFPAPAAEGDESAATAKTSASASEEGQVTLLEGLLLSDVRLRRLSTAPRLSHALLALYLRLVANTNFKSAFAKAFAKHYDAIARAYMESSWDDGLVYASQISVQFFNRPAIVLPLVQSPRVALLHRMLTLMCQLVKDMSLGPDSAADSSLLVRKRHLPLVSDLRFVLAIASIPQLFLNDHGLMQKWSDLLSSLQAFDMQRRQHGVHVEHEHDGWVGCFNFIIQVSSPELRPMVFYPPEASPVVIPDVAHRVANTLSFHYPLHRVIASIALRWSLAEGGGAQLALMQEHLASRQVVHTQRAGDSIFATSWEHASSVVPEVVERLQPKQQDDDDGDAFGDDDDHHDESSDEEVQVRSPLHRYRKKRTYALRLTLSEVLLLSPIRLLGSCAAIGANLWARNGTCMQEQLANYVSIAPPLSRQMADLDRFAVQLAASTMPPVNALGMIFGAFGQLRLLYHCMEPIRDNNIESQGEDEAAGAAGAAGAVAAVEESSVPSPSVEMDAARDPASVATVQSLLAFTFGSKWPAGAYQAGEMLSRLEEPAVSGHPPDVRQRTAMLEECLHMLLCLASHTPRPAGLEHTKAEIRSTVIHLLLIRPRAYSELVDPTVQIDDDQPSEHLLQEQLDEVAVAQQGPSSILYTLKDGLAKREYRIASTRLLKADHQAAAERIEASLRRAKAPDAAAERAPPSPAHPAFASVRLLAVHPAVLQLCRSILVHTLHNPPPHVDSSRCVDRVIHLLELGAQCAIADPSVAAGFWMAFNGESAECGCMVALACARPSRLRETRCNFGPPDSATGMVPESERIRRAPQHIFACGHAMHFNCWKRHLESSLENQRQQQQLLEDLNLQASEHKKQEAFCPLCRAVTNVALPLIPQRRASLTPSYEDRALDDPAERCTAAIESIGTLERALADMGAAPDEEEAAPREAIVPHAEALHDALVTLTELRRRIVDMVPDGRPGDKRTRSLEEVGGTPLYVLINTWCSVALSFEAAASEWQLVDVPSASTGHSLRTLFRSLALRRDLLLHMIEANRAAGASIGGQGASPPAELVGYVISRLTELWLNLLQGGSESSSAWHGGLIPPGCPTLLGCSLEAVAVALLESLPPSSVNEARTRLDLVALAVVAKTLLSECGPIPAGNWLDEEEEAMKLPADVDEEELEALVELRRILAKAAKMPLHEGARRGRSLYCAVAWASQRFQRVAALLLEASCPRQQRAGGSGSASARGEADDDEGRPFGAEAFESIAPPRASAILRSAAARAQMERWAASLAEAYHLRGQEAAQALLGGPQRQPPALMLDIMPPDFASLTASLNRRTCSSCGKPPIEPALCLLCGTLLCAGPNCRRPLQAGEAREGECTRHARVCGFGVGIFALVHQCVTLLIDDSRACYHQSLYLDAHNEEDRGLKRGKPLFLNKARVAAIRKLWLAQGIPHEVARNRAGASSLVRLGFY